MTGMKHDTGKAPIVQGVYNYFPRALAAVAFVSQFGFDKYQEWGGWRKVPDALNRYENALGRHALDGARGEENCPESKQKHRAHRAWNALATLELVLIEEEAERGLQAIKDQSWADAANEPSSKRDDPETAARFDLLKQDALMRAKGLNIDGSTRRETVMLPIIDDAGGDAPAEPFKLITPSEIEKVLYAPKTPPVEPPKKFTTCGKCDDIQECGRKGRCFGR